MRISHHLPDWPVIVPLACLIACILFLVVAAIFGTLVWKVLCYAALAGHIASVVVLNICDDRHAARRHAEEDRFRQWKCPNCEEAYGPNAMLLHCEGVIDAASNPPRQCCVAMVCTHCKYGNEFDSAGIVVFRLPGVYFDPQVTTEAGDKGIPR